jgi:hypothetical protein
MIRVHLLIVNRRRSKKSQTEPQIEKEKNTSGVGTLPKSDTHPGDPALSGDAVTDMSESNPVVDDPNTAEGRAANAAPSADHNDQDDITIDAPPTRPPKTAATSPG